MAKLETTLKVALAEKQKTLRPEIRLLNEVGRGDKEGESVKVKKARSYASICICTHMCVHVCSKWYVPKVVYIQSKSDIALCFSSLKGIIHMVIFLVFSCYKERREGSG